MLSQNSVSLPKIDRKFNKKDKNLDFTFSKKKKSIFLMATTGILDNPEASIL